MSADTGFIVRMILGVILSVSAGAKARDVGSFTGTVQQVILLVAASASERLARVLAAILIGAEAATAGLLFTGSYPLVSGIGALALFLFFASVAAFTLKRRVLIPCSCFGAGEGTLGRRTLARALVFAVMASAYILASIAGDGAAWPASAEEALASSAVVVGVLILLQWAVNADVPLGLAHERTAGQGAGQSRSSG